MRIKIFRDLSAQAVVVAHPVTFNFQTTHVLRVRIGVQEEDEFVVIYRYRVSAYGYMTGHEIVDSVHLVF